MGADGWYHGLRVLRAQRHGAGLEPLVQRWSLLYSACETKFLFINAQSCWRAGWLL
jgi:hypothetical protein